MQDEESFGATEALSIQDQTGAVLKCRGGSAADTGPGRLCFQPPKGTPGFQRSARPWPAMKTPTINSVIVVTRSPFAIIHAFDLVSRGWKI